MNWSTGDIIATIVGGGGVLRWAYEILVRSGDQRIIEARSDSTVESRVAALERSVSLQERRWEKLDETLNDVRLEFSNFRGAHEQTQKNMEKLFERFDRGLANVQAQVRNVATGTADKILEVPSKGDTS